MNENVELLSFFEAPAPSKSQQLIDFETNFGDHDKNEEYWNLKSKKKIDDELDSIQKQIKEVYEKHLECQQFRTKLKNIYDFTQMVGPVGLAKKSRCSEIIAIEAKSIGINSIDDFIQYYPPNQYCLYFYEVYHNPSCITANSFTNKYFKYTIRFAVIEKD